MKQHTNTETPLATAALVQAVIEPIVAWATAERGRKKTLITALDAAAPGESITRNLVESWLRVDPTKRHTPNLGKGLLLMQVATRLGIINPEAILK